MIFGSQRVLPPFVIYIPKVVFRVVAMGVEPLYAAEGVDLALQSTVLVHKVRGVSEPRAQMPMFIMSFPSSCSSVLLFSDNDIFSSFVCNMRRHRSAACVRVHRSLCAFYISSQRVDLERPNPESLVNPLYEQGYVVHGYYDILDKVILCHAILVEAVVQNVGP